MYIIMLFLFFISFYGIVLCNGELLLIIECYYGPIVL